MYYLHHIINSSALRTSLSSICFFLCNLFLVPFQIPSQPLLTVYSSCVAAVFAHAFCLPCELEPCLPHSSRANWASCAPPLLPKCIDVQEDHLLPFFHGIHAWPFVSLASFIVSAVRKCCNGGFLCVCFAFLSFATAVTLVQLGLLSC